jgi:glycerol-3-phosphate dehydrogenase
MKSLTAMGGFSSRRGIITMKTIELATRVRPPLSLHGGTGLSNAINEPLNVLKERMRHYFGFVARKKPDPAFYLLALQRLGLAASDCLVIEDSRNGMLASHPSEPLKSVWPEQRRRTISTLSNDPWDVLVVGGGIVGSGIARDASMRGLRTVLIEKSDFAWGTSSRSARLLHGGLRYLAQGNIKLVREASLEKMILNQIAPHLAVPLPFLFPTYKGSPWKRWKLGIGVKIYDLLCGGRNLGKSELLSSKTVGKTLQTLKRDGLTGGVRYFDGQTDDARLVLDTLASAEQRGATLVNYLRLVGAVRDDHLWRCEAEDMLGNQTVNLRARVVVNATGPWSSDFPESQVKIRGTKGVHLILDRNRLPVNEAVMLTENKRVVWAVPWGERVYVGCTDTDYHQPLDAVKTEPEDINYLLAVLNDFFPRAAYTARDVLGTWAGVRPLVIDRHGKPSEVSRSHEIRTNGQGWFDVAGGKLTTYRKMAQQVVDRLVDYLHVPVSPCRTSVEPLFGSAEPPRYSGIVPPAVTRAAVQYYCCNEWAVHLDDVMIRRARWHYYEPNPDKVAETVAGWMGELLGWDASVKGHELQRYRNYHH